MWHQLSTKIVQFMAPLNPLRPPDVSRNCILSVSNEIKNFRDSPIFSGFWGIFI